ncbi:MULTISPECIES: carboxypeptidase M32 [Leuconostoc]|uniref:Metal-dependent carboxypeptidase n=1 Tax=Leuconostoc pseudomesenteroides TaxID=33968 RepID=A0A5B8T407_LEUPS|nr:MULTISPECIES: carboxypeptidase M32 [Leuconostoc]MCC7668872.1 carboxypeptidase M32 [Leuconostoc pseudomesenteroides]MCC8439467.1 carboxypeptidase M32 [Leuconostoc pseudomesenteroides]MDG9733546.1 carboxypeptidase M32 [Leuconostoc pseudomesenteroides]MDN2451055.1 carboxypeptidase M32 [Leuconostoc sp. UCMA20149]NKZ36017.1 carboxypeptidase M32 [Leuconostoc pseudomesenteroides]
MTTQQDLFDSVKEQTLLSEIAALSGWDALTGMPKDAGHFRADVDAYLAQKIFTVSTGEHRQNILKALSSGTNQLDELGRLVLEKAQKDYDMTGKIPEADFIAFEKTLSQAQDYWAQAREANDYKIFQPYLEKIIGYLKQFIPLWQTNEVTPYDVLLNQYEPGLTVAKLDAVFAQVKTGVTELRQRLAKEGTTPEDSFLKRRVTKEQQRQYAMAAAQRLGYNLNKGRLDDTIHPFMEALNRDDARITTRWDDYNFQMAVLGIFHEAGHGLFEQNVDPKYDDFRSVLPISMSIHESQSLFNEVMIGRSKAFWETEYPQMQQAFEGVLDDVDFETFYAGWLKTQASFTRTEADPLTYPLHIIIRYEIEKAIFNDNIDVADLPVLWNAKYKEYLDLDTPDDLTGILQDIHWAGGSFGYFPSYALGHLYAAQFQATMAKSLDFEAIFASGDYSPIFEWRKEHIWQYGGAVDPQVILKEATGESLNPQYWLDLQTKQYLAAYGIDD